MAPLGFLAGARAAKEMSVADLDDSAAAKQGSQSSEQTSSSTKLTVSQLREQMLATAWTHSNMNTITLNEGTTMEPGMQSSEKASLSSKTAVPSAESGMAEKTLDIHTHEGPGAREKLIEKLKAEAKARTDMTEMKIETLSSRTTAELVPKILVFAPFPRLVIELRLKIWKETFPKGREVELICQQPSASGYQVDLDLTLPEIYYVNREAREFVESHYQIVPRQGLGGARLQQPLYANLATDIVVLRSILIDLRVARSTLSRLWLGYGCSLATTIIEKKLKFLAKIQTLCIVVESGSSRSIAQGRSRVYHACCEILAKRWKGNSFLKYFNGLRKIILSVPESDYSPDMLRHLKEELTIQKDNFITRVEPEVVLSFGIWGDL